MSVRLVSSSVRTRTVRTPSVSATWMMTAGMVRTKKTARVVSARPGSTSVTTTNVSRWGGRVTVMMTVLMAVMKLRFCVVSRVGTRFFWMLMWGITSVTTTNVLRWDGHVMVTMIVLMAVMKLRLLCDEWGGDSLHLNVSDNYQRFR